MARPNKPLNVLQLNGTAKNHPARLKARENEPENINPIGEPLAFLKEDEIVAWDLIVNRCIPDVLGEADSLAVALASKLLAAEIRDEANNQDKNLLKSYLGQFGMTPSERAKISVPKPKPKNRFDA